MCLFDGCCLCISSLYINATLIFELRDNRQTKTSCGLITILSFVIFRLFPSSDTDSDHVSRQLDGCRVDGGHRQMQLCVLSLPSFATPLLHRVNNSWHQRSRFPSSSSPSSTPLHQRSVLGGSLANIAPPNCVIASGRIEMLQFMKL